MRIAFRHWLGFFVILALFPLAAWSDEVVGLYEAEMPVFSQQRDERSTAIQTAFVQVLERVSGRHALAELPGLADSLSNSGRYVQQYRYRRIEPRMLPGDPDREYKQVLWVRFDERAVNKLLREQGLPVWGKTRPATLVWLALDTGGRRAIIGNDSDHEIREVLMATAQRRGLPLRLPLFDLQDRSAIRVSDVWGNFSDAILGASRRYQTDAVLNGRVYQGFGGVWHGRWSLYSGARRDDWEFRGTELAEVVRPALDQVAGALSVRFAEVKPEQDRNTVTVLVQDIRSLADFNRVYTYLNALSGVESTQPAVVEANDAVFQLVTRKGRLGIAQAISLGYLLTADTSQSTTTAPATQPTDTVPSNEESRPALNLTPDLVYRLVP